MEKKTSKSILLAIMGVLILAELVASIISGFEYGIILAVCKIVSLTFIALYGFWLYKNPHGNMLKYTMILLALAQMIHVSHCLAIGVIAEHINVTGMISAGILVYVAGRLNRIEQNKYLLFVSAVLNLFGSVSSMVQDASLVKPVFLITYQFETIAILTLMIAYFVRFKEHKEAGLMDAPKK